MLLVTSGYEAHSQARGFTMMEVLVAMTLLALLMTALSGSIGFVGRSWDRGWETGERSAAFSRIENTLRRMVERSFPVDGSRGKEPAFPVRGERGWPPSRGARCAWGIARHALRAGDRG